MIVVIYMDHFIHFIYLCSIIKHLFPPFRVGIPLSPPHIWGFLHAQGKPLGTHQAKQIRCVGLLKFIRNLFAHKTEAVERGRFESETAIAQYILSSLPWLLMAVHTLDARHKGSVGPQLAEPGAGASEEDRMLRMSFAANVSSQQLADS